MKCRSWLICRCLQGLAFFFSGIPISSEMCKFAIIYIAFLIWYLFDWGHVNIFWPKHERHQDPGTRLNSLQCFKRFKFRHHHLWTAPSMTNMFQMCHFERKYSERQRQFSIDLINDAQRHKFSLHSLNQQIKKRLTDLLENSTKAWTVCNLLF